LFLCHGFTAAMPEHRGASRCVAYKSVNSLHHFTRFTVCPGAKVCGGTHGNRVESTTVVYQHEIVDFL
jgi:hypothetical protein